MKQPNKQVPLGRAVLCVLMCVVFTALTTYQFCYYAVLSDYRTQLGEQTSSMQAEFDLLIAERDAQIASLTASLNETESARATLEAEVGRLTERLVSITGSKEGTAEDCLRLLLIASLKKQYSFSSTSAGKYMEEEVNAYIEKHASTFVGIAERLMLIDFLYQTNYVREAPSAEEAQKAMAEGYIAAAGDMYAVYYTPAEYRDFADQMNSKIRCGIGVVSTIDPAGDAILVLHVHRNSPALRAGMQAGDRIVSVAGQLVAEIGYDAARALVAGEPGTTLEMIIDRNGTLIEISAVRQAVEADSVIYRSYTENGKRIGYIRLLSFSSKTPEHMKAAYESLMAEGIEALVFDVRDNTGGYLEAIVEVLDFILPSGKLLISFSYGNENHSKAPYYSTDDHEITLPLVVLQNRNTASAAELFACALRDYGRATLIGETTYGKCTMQSGYKLSDGSYITVTVADYLPPSGKSYEGKGLTPDRYAPLDEAYATRSIYLLPEEHDIPLHEALALLSGNS